jgi:hypothetical protein
MSERHKAAALARGAARTTKIGIRVDDTMRDIADEMKANGGIYPKNGGAVSMAEIARRAEIDESTFYKKDNAALKEKVALWLETLKKKETVGRMRVRKNFQQRAESWKEKYDALTNRHIRTELDLQKLQADHEKLRGDYDALLEQMRVAGKSNVTPIPKGKH